MAHPDPPRRPPRPHRRSTCSTASAAVDTILGMGVRWQASRRSADHRVRPPLLGPRPSSARPTTAPGRSSPAPSSTTTTPSTSSSRLGRSDVASAISGSTARARRGRSRGGARGGRRGSRRRSGSRPRTPAPERDVAEEAEDGAGAGDDQLLAVVLAEAALAHLGLEEADGPVEERLEHGAEVDAEVALTVERLAPHDPHELGVLAEEVERRGDDVVGLAPALAVRHLDGGLDAARPSPTAPTRRPRGRWPPCWGSGAGGSVLRMPTPAAMSLSDVPSNPCSAKQCCASSEDRVAGREAGVRRRSRSGGYRYGPVVGWVGNDRARSRAASHQRHPRSGDGCPHAARSGHQGTAMALAPLAHVLWTRVMRYDADATRTGPTATGSCCRPGTRRSSCTRCSTSPATT